MYAKSYCIIVLDNTNYVWNYPITNDYVWKVLCIPIAQPVHTVPKSEPPGTQKPSLSWLERMQWYTRVFVRLLHTTQYPWATLSQS